MNTRQGDDLSIFEQTSWKMIIELQTFRLTGNSKAGLSASSSLGCLACKFEHSVRFVLSGIIWNLK